LPRLPLFPYPTLFRSELRGRAVLVHTGWDAHWATPGYADGHPYLTGDAAAYLRDCGVALVGIDSMNIDDTRGKARPVHSTLLGADRKSTRLNSSHVKI